MTVHFHLSRGSRTLVMVAGVLGTLVFSLALLGAVLSACGVKAHHSLKTTTVWSGASGTYKLTTVPATQWYLCIHDMQLWGVDTENCEGYAGS